MYVVICLKISIFVVAITTLQTLYVSLHTVVICLKISIFVVAITTLTIYYHHKDTL